MVRSKLLVCVLAGGLATVAVAAPLGAAATGKSPRQVLANSPLGKLLTGHLGRAMILRSELNVSDQQRAQIREVVGSHKPEIAKAAQAVWERRNALHDAVMAERPDEAAIRKAADELGKTIGDAAVLGSKVAAQVKPFLTDQQRQHIKECKHDCEAATAKFFAGAGK